jgi:transposase
VSVLDNASLHACLEVSEHIDIGAEQGLILYNLPPYNANLNAIEHLWRKLKHQVKPESDWETLDSLAQSLLKSLEQLGDTFQHESMLAA